MAALTDRQLVVDRPILADEMPDEWKDFFTNPLTMFDQSSLALKDSCSLGDLKNALPGDPNIKNLGKQNDAEGYARLGQIIEDKEPVVYFGTSMNFKPDTKCISDAEYWARYRLFYENLDPVSRVTKTVNQFKKEKMLAIPALADRIVTAPYKIDRSTIEGTQNALIDWYLLGATNFIIGTYQSSFSDEAAHLTNKRTKVHLGEAAYK